MPEKTTIFRKKMKGEDVIIFGTNRIAVIECKLAKPDKALSHLWEGSIGSVEKCLDRHL